jgi:hypothetical protein
MNVHRAFFGDAEYPFALSAKLIAELERKSGAGIGTICQRAFAGHISHTDIIETIRLGLIGGGVAPERAQTLIETYALNRPLAEVQPLASDILESVWFGAPPIPQDDNAAS